MHVYVCEIVYLCTVLVMKNKNLLQCAKVQMPLLTLARYILEYSLMDYSIITLSDSKLAAAALLLAFKMTNHGEWSNTLQYFTGDSW